jgi:hypothetical protein
VLAAGSACWGQHGAARRLRGWARRLAGGSPPQGLRVTTAGRGGGFLGRRGDCGGHGEHGVNRLWETKKAYLAVCFHVLIRRGRGASNTVLLTI